MQHFNPYLVTEFPSDEELSLLTAFPSDEELAEGLKTYAYQMSLTREHINRKRRGIMFVLTQYGLFSQENMDAGFCASRGA